MRLHIPDTPFLPPTPKLAHPSPANTACRCSTPPCGMHSRAHRAGIATHPGRNALSFAPSPAEVCALLHPNPPSPPLALRALRRLSGRFSHYFMATCNRAPHEPSLAFSYSPSLLRSPTHSLGAHSRVMHSPLPPVPPTQGVRFLSAHAPIAATSRLPSRPPLPLKTPSPSAPPSDGVGLLSVKHAVALVGGAVWLSADDKHTTFHLKLPAQPCAHEDTDADACTKGGRPAAAAPEPSACVADLPSFVESSLPPSAAAPVPFCTPTAALSPATCLAPAAAVPRAAQVSTGGDSAAVASNPDTGSRPPPASGRPVCIGIDDSLMLRKTQVRCPKEKGGAMRGSCSGASAILRLRASPPCRGSLTALHPPQSMLFRLFLQADPSRSGSIGGTAEEVSGFVDVVMGRKELCVRPGERRCLCEGPARREVRVQQREAWRFVIARGARLRVCTLPSFHPSTPQIFEACDALPRRHRRARPEH
jgi:hypothetical protein